VAVSVDLDQILDRGPHAGIVVGWMSVSWSIAAPAKLFASVSKPRAQWESYVPAPATGISRRVPPSRSLRRKIGFSTNS
jgi:hypothetical protein